METQTVQWSEMVEVFYTFAHEILANAAPQVDAAPQVVCGVEPVPQVRLLNWLP